MGGMLDTIVVGGGPAGLSAALVLGRCLRKVLVCDAGHPRNEPAKIFNGYLSRDGSTPAEFLAISREQLQRYETVQLRQTVVADIVRGEGEFTAILESGERLVARTILIATGLVDVLPQIQNFRQFYGKSAHSCPYCDGWEARGQPIAVVGADQAAADLAIELLLWSPHIVLCTNNCAPTYDDTTRQTMERVGVKIISNCIARLEGSGEDLEGIRFTDHTFLKRKALFFSPGQFQRSPLAERLGCDFCAEDGCIQSGLDTATNVPGVYAAGNCSRGIQLVIAAVSEGMQAAFAINNALLEADAASGVLRHTAKNAIGQQTAA
jgi:thioredoxin reductase